LEEIYPEELGIIFARIKERRYDNYLMLLAISTNPHLKQGDQKPLWKSLQINSREDKSEDFDIHGFNRLKDALSNNPKFIVKS
jgi:hypothetical protein